MPYKLKFLAIKENLLTKDYSSPGSSFYCRGHYEGRFSKYFPVRELNLEYQILQNIFFFPLINLFLSKAFFIVK